MIVEFTVPGQPHGKGRPRFSRSGHTYTPGKTVEYENLVRLAYMDKYGRLAVFRAEQAIKAIIRCVFPIPSSTGKKNAEKMRQGEIKHMKYPDVDNIIKSILDGCNGIVFPDDRQIYSIDATKEYGDDPRVEVTFTDEVDR